MKNTIKIISAQNLKGQSFEHKLAPVTMFVGDNFAGKTSRIDAVFLALLGWLPGIAKKPGDIYADLASGPELGVTAVLEDREIGRLWRESKGSVKYIGTGDDIDFPPVALVTSEFLSLSAAERVKFLFARAKLPPGFNLADIQLSLTTSVKRIKFEDHSEYNEHAINELVDFISQRQTSVTAQEFVTNLAVDVNEKKKLAVQAVQRMEKTQQGLVVIAPDAQASSSAEAALKTAQEEYTQTRAALSTVESEGRRIVSEVGRLKSLASFAMANEAASRAELESLSKEKEKIAKACINIPDSSKLNEEIASLSRELAEAGAAAKHAIEAYTQAEANRNELKADKNPCCKTCGQSIKKLIESVLEAAEKAVVKTWETRCKTRDAEAKLVEKMNSLEEKRKALYAEVALFKQNQARFRDVSARHASIQSALEKNTEASAAQADLPAFEARLADLRDTFKQNQEAEVAAKKKVDELEQGYKDLIAQRSRYQQQELARQELARSRAESEVLKEAVKMLAELQSKLVDAAVAPLIENANKLCGSILKMPLAYKDGDIGFACNGQFYSHRSFSGTEKALAYAAISVALAQDAPLKLVIIDELGRLTKKNKQKLILNLCEAAQSGVIDQAILVDLEDPDFRDEQFKLIEL